MLKLGKIIDSGGNRFNAAQSGAVLPFSCFAAPGAFTPGNAGRNIVPGPGIIYSQASASKNFAFKERYNVQFRFDFQNPFHNWGSATRPPQWISRTRSCFGKINVDQTTASFAGEPLMNLTLKFTW